ncbi:hypothetical protein ACFFOM_02765 [Microlunatus capsulatus]|uniref:Dolichyl-phosphate-mannose-protein mannosyltransferase n=1 Tax=Microlunatus capsulatus TaxID=99117 RepID=A0ABS4Z2S4_9ACTN|nr:hypothetical protein [Microlunatus capsulatus]MBP2415352.1 hypothetical protein [Microlunatus capsulatus]
MPDRPRPLVGRVGVGLACAAVLAACLVFLVAPLNPNLRYEAGVKLVSDGSAAGTFSHRPLAYRLVMDAVFRAARASTSGVVAFELAVRVLLVLLALAAGALLGRGLARQGVGAPWLHAAVVAVGLVVLGPVSGGEPDWMAALLTAAGVGVALLGDRGRAGLAVLAVLAGVLLVAAAGMKVVTLPVAVLGLVVVLALDRGRGLRVLGGSVVVGVLVVVATLLLVPWEVHWLLDIRAVQVDAAEQLPDAGPFLLALAADHPVLALLPAALVLVPRAERAVVAVAVLVTGGMVVAQGQYFGYHALPLLVVALVAVFRALRGRMGAAAGAVLLVAVTAASALTTTSTSWQTGHQRLWVGGLALLAVAGLGWAGVVRGRRPDDRRAGAAVAAVAALALLVPGATPWSAQLLRPADPDGERPPSTRQVRDDRRATVREVHAVVGGAGVPVTYLTSGEWTYWLGNPTRCRYPSPLFLQRTRQQARLGTASYRENLACLSAPGSRWLVVETSWFVVGRQPPDVRAVLDQEWDCDAAREVGRLRLCPRRA